MQTARDKVDKFSSDLESYVASKGLPLAMPRGIEHYLTMERSELSIMSAEALGEIAYEISCYAYYLQNVHNQQVAKAAKCRHEIEKIVAPILDNYKHIWGKDDKWLAAIVDNEAARKYRDIEVNAQAAATRTSYLTQRLEHVSKCLSDLHTTKRRQNA